jgi:hypothetical protein
MTYYLNTYLDGCDQFEAYKRFGLDYAIYCGPNLSFNEKDLANWQNDYKHWTTPEGNAAWSTTITTPEGQLFSKGESNQFTGWETEHLIKTKRDWELFDKYFPVPEKVDWTPVREIRDRLGDKGIIRGCLWAYGQMGAWQSFCCMVGTQNAILYAMDEPEWVHQVEQNYVNKQLKVIELMATKYMPMDLIETGGGAGSNTVISPKLHAEFCTPYDRQQHDAIHDILGTKIVYHLCGGLMHQLENVVDNHADGLETMTPPSMGGDCDLAEATRRVGDKLFFIGGFDQNQGFEHGTPEDARRLVFELYKACPDGGYICSPSDHFFFGDPANLQAFSDACKECTY